MRRSVSVLGNEEVRGNEMEAVMGSLEYKEREDNEEQ